MYYYHLLLNTVEYYRENDSDSYMLLKDASGNIERASTSRSLVRIPISNESLYHATQKKGRDGCHTQDPA